MSLTSTERLTIESYDKIAQTRLRTLTTNINFWLPEFQELILNSPPNPVFLDLGCGDGREAALYRETFGNLKNYIGLDISTGMINGVSGRGLDYCPLVQANIHNLPIKTGSVDFVWASASLIHTPRENISVQFSEIHRCLKTGGKAFISLKNGEGEGWEVGSNPADRRYLVYWQPDDLTQVLRNSGFEVGPPWVDTTKDYRGIHWLCVYALKNS